MTSPEKDDIPRFWLPVNDAKGMIMTAMERPRMYAVTREAWHLYIYMIMTAAIDSDVYVGTYITRFNGFDENDRLPLDDEHAREVGARALEFFDIFEYTVRPQPSHWCGSQG